MLRVHRNATQGIDHLFKAGEIDPYKVFHLCAIKLAQRIHRTLGTVHTAMGQLIPPFLRCAFGCGIGHIIIAGSIDQQNLFGQRIHHRKDVHIASAVSYNFFIVAVGTTDIDHKRLQLRIINGFLRQLLLLTFRRSCNNLLGFLNFFFRIHSFQNLRLIHPNLFQHPGLLGKIFQFLYLSQNIQNTTVEDHCIDPMIQQCIYHSKQIGIARCGRLHAYALLKCIQHLLGAALIIVFQKTIGIVFGFFQGLARVIGQHIYLSGGKFQIVHLSCFQRFHHIQCHSRNCRAAANHDHR